LRNEPFDDDGMVMLELRDTGADRFAVPDGSVTL
jgi:hypothetical protein